MVSKSYRLCPQSGRESIFAPACGPSSSVGINIEAQIIRFDAFLHAGVYLLEPEEIFIQKKKAAGFPPPP
jgi:hypothetical protein